MAYGIFLLIWEVQFRCFFRDQVFHPGGRASGAVGVGSGRSGWGASVVEKDSALEFVNGGWEGE